ncbi:MAG: ABC transporter permease [Propionicimonas sp.]|uniref:ABC transporter permease n=1 Tax=Propionicimonas sp. TaxID=1955623 RepID=UPI002B200C5C|nr:ABC transporter permease [Propionicimonas sp.]MEA4945550.1 ABC transporter permease [Propionicimonas sp.]MEA5054814.1 ABC transporter permease [Propionicimonas sp.]MEA5117640.1 ABC transporter permease [Propionicimonas sp.]
MTTTFDLKGPGRQRPFATAMAERPVMVLLGVFVIFYLVAAMFDHSLLTIQGARGILLLACPLAMFAGAQTICMLTGGIDMSVSMIATFAAYIVVDQMGGGVVWALLAGLLVGAGIGAVNGIGVGVFKVSAMIMTLGMQSVLLGVITVGAGASGFLDGSRGLPDIIKTLGTGSVGPIPANTFLLIGMSVLLVWGLSRTGLGRNLYAVGDNPIACRLAGIRVWQVLIATYAVAGVLAAIGGMLIAGMNGSVGPDMANIYLLPSVAAAVVGGTSVMGGIGGFGGTVVGALILTVLNRLLLTFDTSEAMRQFIYGLIVLGLAWVYSRLTGAKARS